MERSPILAKPERKSSYYGDCVTFARVKCGQELSKLIGPIVNPCKTWLKTYLFVVRKHYESPTTKLNTTYLVFAPEFMGNPAISLHFCLPELFESNSGRIQVSGIAASVAGWRGNVSYELRLQKENTPTSRAPISAQESCIRFENFEHSKSSLGSNESFR